MHDAQRTRSTRGARSRLSSALFLGALLIALGAVVAGPAGAGEAQACTWTVKSLDRDGKVIDTASGPGQGATRDDPLLIDSRGSIAYEGTTDEVIAHGSWTVEVRGGAGIWVGGDVEDDSCATQESANQ